MVDSRAGDLLRAPKGLKLLELLSQHRASELTDEDLTNALVHLDVLVSRYMGDYAQYVAALQLRAPEFRALAEWLPTRMANWWDDLDRDHQVWIGSTPDAPVERLMDVDLSQFHAEAPKPRRAFWTSTYVPVQVSPWLNFAERRSRGHGFAWQVVVAASARVLEIHSPRAWFDLARAYPRPEPGFTYTSTLPRPLTGARTDPEWSAVARDWDGVHLSVGGWLTSEDVTHDSAGLTTELRGWNLESTVWLRWAFGSVDRIDSVEP